MDQRRMDLSFAAALGDIYKSPSQKIRKLSEHWAGRNMYCPGCDSPEISGYSNNRPVADFFCAGCGETYELKSQARKFGPKVADGAYGTMMERLRAGDNPNLLLLHYAPVNFQVMNLLVVPKYFFVPAMIEARKPLIATAKRAGWIGCNISIKNIPSAGQIYLIRDQVAVPRQDVLNAWRRTLFLADQKDLRAKGWLLSVMRCIERIQKPVFTISEVYTFADELQADYPLNNNIKPKIRQKLQILRDKNYIEFLGGGTYRLVP